MLFGIQEIKSNTYIIPLEQLLRKLQEGAINKRMRHYDCQYIDCYDYIEKLIIGIPLQSFYFTALNQMAMWNTVDGQRRLDTLDEFFNKGTLIIAEPRLVDIEQRIFYEGLPFSLRRKLLETEVTVHLLLGSYSPSEIRELHRLINKQP